MRIIRNDVVFAGIVRWGRQASYVESRRRRFSLHKTGAHGVGYGDGAAADVELAKDVGEVRCRGPNQPFSALSVEMVHRGLYHYTVAVATGDCRHPVDYIATRVG
ncbi:MAG: hypothetical protein H0U38_07865 [Chloroflexia bacterium]|nr:hypothetical protein [Chloroflexia bacterium]